MKFGLEEDVIRKICFVFVGFSEIDKVVLYGSRAKGKYKAGSDIDLCLFGKNIDLAFLYRLDQVLDDLLLPYSFDLSIYSHLSNPEIIDHIDRVGVVFYSKNDFERPKEPL